MTPSMPWLVPDLQRFEARLARGQTPQGLLVHGPEGIGRRHFALTLAARLLGTDWRPAPDAPRDTLTAVPHPDFWGIGCEEDSRSIKIDQIRALSQALMLTSHRGGWKVALIWPADAMTHSAANTLLKTLEEPPAATTLILVADSPGRLPATIVSRCERIRLALPTPAVALAWLVEVHGDRNACERALAYAGGAPLLADAVLRGGDAVIRALGDLADDLQKVIDREVPPTTIARAWARRDASVCLRWLYLQTAALLRRQAGHAGASGAGALYLKIPDGPVNMAACCAHLDQVMAAQRLKDRSLNMEAIFADLLMWWYGAAGAFR